ncbi:MAG: 1-acyl-sn-glycerol-3-phosphate acyltransferase [Candidatus Dormibacteraeota bacterium]|nr:1-acyl-sn-glycerol-3-phosphate acyltransferase [Candidatus Dormibacteraeota bacterium]
MKTTASTIDLPPADLLPVGRHASLLFRCLRTVLAPLIKALFRVRIEGRENVPEGAFVIAANHLGWLDSFLILMAFPPEPHVHFLGAVRGLAARKAQWRIVRWVGGYIPVDMEHRGDPRLYRHVERCLEAGGAVGFYPEACYGCPGELQPFRKGFAHFAVGARVPVVPVALNGTDRLWLRREVSVVIGEPLRGDEVDELVDRTRGVLDGMLPPPTDLPRTRLLEAGLTNLF